MTHPDFDSSNRQLTDQELRIWDEAEWNTIQEVCCRAHPDGADAFQVFCTFWEEEKGLWLGPHRAFGAWLGTEFRRLLAEATRVSS